MAESILLPSRGSDSFSRRCSTETVLTIQGQETDYVRDTTDTEFASDAERDLEYEPATESEDEAGVDCGDSSGQSENEIIATKVIAVSVGDDGDLEFADSEQTDSDGSDSEMDLYDYWQCAQCRAHNNNPLYRYCERCFKVRKNFFPPRPKRKRKRATTDPDSIPRTLSQDSGVESQELSQNDRVLGSSTLNEDRLQETSFNPQNGPHNPQKGLYNSRNRSLNPQSVSLNPNNVQDSLLNSKQDLPTESENNSNIPNTSRRRKRRSESADSNKKRAKISYDSESESDENTNVPIQPLIKTISDPSISIDEVRVTKKVISNTLKEKLENDNLCIICFTEPKSGVFVHGRIAHICCCYKCAVKVWTKAKRCPVCNSKVSNVLKAVVM